MWITEVFEALDYNMGPAIFLWRVPNIFLGNTDCGIGVWSQVQRRVGKGSIVRAGPTLSCWNSMDLGDTKTQELTQSTTFRGRPESPWTGSVSSEPYSFLWSPQPLPFCTQVIIWNGLCIIARLWWLNRCQETWSGILVPPLASYGTKSTLLNLFEPTSLGAKWLWSAYVLRVLWGLNKVYYLENLLENIRCLIKCQTQGKIVQSI